MAHPGPGPHGGAPAHGAPPAYAPPPVYGAPPPGPPPGGPPRPPRSPAFWIALGCAAVLILGGVAAAAAWLLFARGPQQALEAFPPASAPPMPTLPAPAVVPVPLPPPTQAPAVGVAAGGVSGASSPPPARSATPGSKVGDAGQTKAPAAAGTAGAASTSVDAGTAAAAPGPTCARAMACCQLLLSKAPPGTAGLTSNCSGMKSWTEAVCEQSLQSSKQAAALLGLSCN